ncbi:uncharacterized protein LOC111693491 [Trichogramma pretiosum]|uniref:uncharacterized protein LOC111693491 n=1 Tax=Trichogramma pretiosum TaxID=7493 RepID=UPI000C71C0F3|nr:uncharacterized protein LOC111693491 [Trichogramma pretiosum]
MKGLIFIAALLFVAVSAEYTDKDKEECFNANYGTDYPPADFNRVFACVFACNFFSNGAVNDDGTLNLPIVKEIFEEDLFPNSNFNYEEVFTKIYRGCRRDYPNICDWEMCMEERLDPYFTEETSNCLLKVKNRVKNIKTILGRSIYNQYSKK